MLSNTYFELFIEPKNEEIAGTFLSLANEEGKQAEGKSRQQKKASAEERSEIKGHSRYVAKPKIKNGWRQEDYCT